MKRAVWKFIEGMIKRIRVKEAVTRGNWSWKTREIAQEKTSKGGKIKEDQKTNEGRE